MAAVLPDPIRATGRALTGHDRREMTVQATERLTIKIEIRAGTMPAKNHPLTTTTRTTTMHQAHQPDLLNATLVIVASQAAVEAEPTSVNPTNNATKGITTADTTTIVTREADPRPKTGTAIKKVEVVRKTTAAGSVAATIGIDINPYKKNLQASLQVFLFPEYEVNRQDEKEKPDEVVPAEGFRFEKDQSKDGENHQGNYFLYHFQLHQ